MSSYQFGPFVLDVRERRLLRAGSPVPLTPKVFDTLAFLVERHGHLVTKDELLARVWGGTSVEEGSLPRAVHVLRKALAAADGTDPHAQYIETVPTKGYRFLAAVANHDSTAAANAAPAEAPPADTPVESGVHRAGSVAWPWSQRLLVIAFSLASLLLIGLTWQASNQYPTPAPGRLGRLSPPTRSGAAYARFQSGRMHLERQLPGDVEVALGDFETAIQLDPRFAAAYAGKADARFFRYWETGAHDDIAQARLAIHKALELDGQGSYAHALQCRLLGTYDWDFAAAQTQCRRAIELDASDPEARRELAFLLSAIGERAAALKEMDAAISIAPSSFNKRSRGLLLYFAGRFDEAIVQLNQIEATDREYRESSRWIARCFEQKRDYAQALESLIRFR